MPLRRLLNLFYLEYREAQARLFPDKTLEDFDAELNAPFAADAAEAERLERIRKGRENRSGFAALAKAFQAA